MATVPDFSAAAEAAFIYAAKYGHTSYTREYLQTALLAAYGAGVAAATSTSPTATMAAFVTLPGSPETTLSNLDTAITVHKTNQKGKS